MYYMNKIMLIEFGDVTCSLQYKYRNNSTKINYTYNNFNSYFRKFLFNLKSFISLSLVKL